MKILKIALLSFFVLAVFNFKASAQRNIVPHTDAILGESIVYASAVYVYTLQVNNNATVSNINWSVPAGWTILWGQGTGQIYVSTGTTGGDVSLTLTEDGTQTAGASLAVAIGTGGGPAQ